VRWLLVSAVRQIVDFPHGQVRRSMRVVRSGLLVSIFARFEGSRHDVACDAISARCTFPDVR
jgi:hypothetical protein